MKTKKRALLVGAGESLLNAKTMKSLAQEVDLVLSADGGFDSLHQMGIQPDFLIGDFDSSHLLSRHKEILKSYQEEDRLILVPTHKDDTDAALSLNYLADSGYEEIYMTGLVGSRLDHSFCNVLYLKLLADRGIRARLLTENNRLAFLPSGSYRLRKPDADWYYSFFTFDSDLHLTLKGFEYEVEDWPIPSYYSKALSNHLLSSDNRVLVEGGEKEGVFIFRSRDASSPDLNRLDDADSSEEILNEFLEWKN